MYSGEADYRSTYTGDENASVFSGLTGMPGTDTSTTHLVVSNVRKKRKRSKRPKSDTGETASPSEYGGGQDNASDYRSTCIDDNATIFSAVTGMEGAETVSNANAMNKTEKKQQGDVQGDAEADYQSTYTSGMDGAGTVVEGSFVGEEAADYQSMYTTDEVVTVYSGAETALGSQVTPINAPTVPTIPIICQTDVDAGTTVGGSNLLEDDGAESVYSSVYVDGQGGPATVYNSGVSGTVYAGGTVYDGTAAQTVVSTPNGMLLPFEALFQSDDWIGFVFGFMTLLLLGCGASIYYLVSVSPIQSDVTDIMMLITNVSDSLMELHQAHMLSMQETRRIENELQLIPDVLQRLQNDISSLQADTQITEQQLNKTLSNGLSPELAIRSCASLPPYYEPGLYYISSTRGYPIQLSCNATFECNGIAGGWMKVADFDYRDYREQCPPNGRELIISNQRGCLITNSGRGCHSFLTFGLGVQYSEVCGRIIGYQRGAPDAFRTSLGIDIDGDYVDGISLTYGHPRQHIWTFTAFSNENNEHYDRKCKCSHPRFSDMTSQPPDFVGEDYFCDTGAGLESTKKERYYLDDPLWDGAGCENENQCCTFNHPPWFYKDIPPTADDIEMRICRNIDGKLEDYLITEIEIYIQ